MKSACATLALSIGVMAQVRIAHANILEVKERYDLDNRTYEAYKKHLKIASQNFSSGGALSRLEVDRYELETAETFINRIISMSSCYVAYYRLLNTLGVNSLDPGYHRNRDAVKSNVQRPKKKPVHVSKIITAYVDLSKEVKFNGILLGNNTATEDRRNKYDELVQQATKAAEAAKEAEREEKF